MLRKILGKRLKYQDKDLEKKFTEQQSFDWFIEFNMKEVENLKKNRIYYDLITKHLDLRRKSKTLDAGCFGGAFELLFNNKKYGEFIGIDLSQMAIKAAKFFKKKYKMKNSKFYVGDIEKLDFPAESFNNILCIAILHHLPILSLRRTIKEFYRVLKPGGKVLIIEPNLLNILNIYLHLRWKFSANEFPYSPGQLRSELSKPFAKTTVKTFGYSPKYNRKIESFFEKIPFINLFGYKILIVSTK